MFGLSRLWASIIAAGAVLAAVTGGWLYVRHLQHETAVARAERDLARGKQVVAEAQADAAENAGAITDAGQARDTTIIIREGEHRAAILSAPGAGSAVDPGLHAALVRGMCGYSVTVDPRCPGLFGADSGVVQATPDGREPARPY